MLTGDIVFKRREHNRDIQVTNNILKFYSRIFSWEYSPLLLHVYKLFYANQHEWRTTCGLSDLTKKLITNWRIWQPLTKNQWMNFQHILTILGSITYLVTNDSHSFHQPAYLMVNLVLSKAIVWQKNSMIIKSMWTILHKPSSNFCTFANVAQVLSQLQLQSSQYNEYLSNWKLQPRPQARESRTM